jgi:hypothetical protein
VVARVARVDTDGVEAPLPNPYEIVSIRSVPAPGGAVGDNWFRYEISQGHNRITGYRDGDMEHVTLAIEAIVFRLNERRRQRGGRVHIVL